MKPTVPSLVLALLVCSCAPVPPPKPGWEARPEIVQSESERVKTGLFREEDVPKYTLPDPLVCLDGTRVTDRSTWEKKRRLEVLELFRTNVFGRSPAPTKVTFDRLPDETVLDGKAIFRQVKIRCDVHDRSIEFPAAVFIPVRRERPVGTFVVVNHRPMPGEDPKFKEATERFPYDRLIEQGFAVAMFPAQELSPDDKVEPTTRGARTALPSPGKIGEDAWGAIAAWAWGASRVADFLQTNPELDARKIAVIGHSRGGKAALWAGAEDQRFSLVISNNSGCTGAALERRKFGETIARINKNFPHWFCGNYKKFSNREEDLPTDQHELLALIAPRGLYVASADEDLWADPRGEFLSLVHASPVYALYSKATFQNQPMPPLDEPVAHGACGYHIRTGPHSMQAYDWDQYMNFAKRLWKK